MRTLVALAVMLLACVGLFLARGLGQVERLREAQLALAGRRDALVELERSVALVPYDEFAALHERRDRAAALVERRRAAVADASIAEPRPDLEQQLSRWSGLGAAPALREAAARTPGLGDALAVVLARLPASAGVSLEALDLAEDGTAVPLGGAAGLREARAQLVLTASPDDALAALEAMTVARGQGLPTPSLLSASLRRIEPERWGAELHRLDAPPVRLSLGLSLLLAPDPGAP